MLNIVYFSPVDADGKESGLSYPIPLVENRVLLDKLPEDIRETLEAFGAPDETKTQRIFPKEGERFLQALLNMTGQYYRFRSSIDA